MTTRAFQKIYTKIDNITKATVTLRAQGVGNDELATVGGKLAQVVKIMGENVTLQVFAGTEGLATDSEVVFHGEPPKLRVSDNLAGRFFNAYGEPLEGGEIVEGEAREIGGPTVNPYRRIQPSELIATGIAGIDLNNTIVTGQKIPFFADPDQPYNAVMTNVALRAKADRSSWAALDSPTTTSSISSRCSRTPVPSTASCRSSIRPRTSPWSGCSSPTWRLRPPSTSRWTRARRCLSC